MPARVRVQLIAMAGTVMSGTSRYATDLCSSLRAAGVEVRLTHPAPAPIPRALAGGLRRLGWDLPAFFRSYPLRVELEPADVYHLTSQTLATLLLFQRFPAPVVVTVLDIIPWLVRRDPALNTLRHPADRFFYRLALAGLKRAEAIIAISEYTKRTLMETLRLPEGRIQVVYPGVDTSRFRPMSVPPEFRERYGLGAENRYVLYVGSDDPRKNLPTLVRAFAHVVEQVPEARLLLLSAARFGRERGRLAALVDELGLGGSIRFVDPVPEDELPLLYNAAGVFVLPSFYEGFGLPVLEAMACGTPVVCSDATALPELAGSAARLVAPRDVASLAAAIVSLLTGTEEQQRLGRAALGVATGSAQPRAALGVLRVYEGALGGHTG